MTMNRKNIGPVVSGFLIASFTFLSPASLFAATTPIGAKAVYVEGSVYVLSVKDKQMRRVKVGSKFVMGDRVRTKSDGIVEIEFDTGDLIRIDRDTDMVIRSLHRDEKGSTFSIFNLIVGRVKSAVDRLTTKDSKFEYHTKTSISGVAGTLFIVESRKDLTSVDHLGKKSVPGAVYVQGFDPAKTMVMVFAGNRTTVRPGAPPLKPFPISRERLQMLKKTMPFKTKPEGKKKVKEKKEAPASTGEQLVTSTISQSISTPKQPKPEEAQSVDSTNTQSTSGQGAVGQYGETGGVSPQQPAKFNIRINLQ